jgi:signal transduction histidine kinase
MGSFSGDRRVVLQVLMNLCANAVKFTDSGGVSITCRPYGSGDIEFEVSDTGRGILVEDMERIFGKFVRIEMPSGAAQAGTGLGLALAKRLTIEHGGDVTVRSVPDQGSTFTARFAPLAG